jgi:hypothetical protein
MSEEEKARKKEYLRKWHLDHKEDQARKKKERRLKNIDETKARDKAYYDKNRDKILEYKREHDNRPRKGNRDWRVIIEKVKEELTYYTSLGIRPTLRTMHYRLYSKGIIHNTKSDYGSLSRKTTYAREQRKTFVSGTKGTRREEYYPRLDINCFADDTRNLKKMIKLEMGKDRDRNM